MKVRKEITSKRLQEDFNGRLDLYFNFLTNIEENKGHSVYEITAKKEKEVFIITLEI